MRRRVLVLGSAVTLVLSPGCSAATQLPVKIQDVLICDNAEAVVGIIQDIAANQKLSFHYGTHSTEYGTQLTFRLIGQSFEIELFNSMRQSDYTLRAYRLTSDATDRTTEQAYARFRAALASKTSDACE
jgi:hypothetical protein